MLYKLAEAGFEVVPEDIDADVVVVNTCAFIKEAKQEAIDNILDIAWLKKNRTLKGIVVAGCLVQRFGEEVMKELPEVDSVVGVGGAMQIVEAVTAAYEGKKFSFIPNPNEIPFESNRVVTTPEHFAYLKIAEGCNRYCSYCAIPLITGKFTSRTIEDILAEVKWLVAKGIKEFNLIAQDLSSYGLDIYGEHRLAHLLDQMAQISGVEWIRIHYTYPTDFPYDILPVMAKHSNICKYMDIALQHCSDHMLHLMRRHITRQQQDALIQRIRQEVPGICLRTTLLVGHPGETEEDFAELCEWVKTMKFDRLGAFAYSEEEGTFAARHYTDDIPQEVKDRRVETIMAIQQTISADILSQMVGTQQRVIIDREEPLYYIGRTQFDSPEVDCEVLIAKAYDETTKPKGDKLKIGEFYTVNIIKSEELDLYAEI
jgi:ribosomal protein S12 methylthiotransferase